MNKSNSKKRKSLITDQHIMDALSKANGIKAQAARILSRSRSWMTERCNKSEMLQAHCVELLEERIDRAEQSIDRMIEDDNCTAVIYFLKTKARHRGYVEHAPLEQVDTAALKRLEDFFSVIGTSRPSSPVAKSVEPEDLDSCKGKTSGQGTNFP